LRPAADFFDLYYRIDGTLIRMKRLPHKLLPSVVSRIKILSNLNITERRLPQDGHIKTSFMTQQVDIRVSIIPTSHGESVVLRILNKQVGLRDVHSIGFSPDDEQRFLDLIHRSNGMLLVTGPTGSGKTTTLYSALQEIHDDSINVVTVEDPVEYELPGMTQIQLLDQIGFGFPQTLRHILRHDPDVIMIGEVRDAETCKIALDAALTGHLVLSTLHTVDAPSALIRLREMGMSALPHQVRRSRHPGAAPDSSELPALHRTGRPFPPSCAAISAWTMQKCFSTERVARRVITPAIMAAPRFTSYSWLMKPRAMPFMTR
jgi:type IV pilus assembly protein PilB